MSVLYSIQPGARLLDKQRGRERLVRAVERLDRMVKIWFDNPRTGGLEPLVYPVAEADIEDGREESERNDEEAESATDAVSPEELRAEIVEVKKLVVFMRYCNVVEPPAIQRGLFI